MINQAFETRWWERQRVHHTLRVTHWEHLMVQQTPKVFRNDDDDDCGRVGALLSVH